VAQDLAQCVANVSSHRDKNHFFGEMKRFAEIVKGNFEAVQEMSQGSLVNGRLTIYNQSLGDTESVVDDVAGVSARNDAFLWHQTIAGNGCGHRKKKGMTRIGE
jgi:hypothetical protein